MNRGQSEVLAVVMLFGLVAVSGAAVVVVGYSAMGSVQEQSATEQQVNEVQSVSQEITDTIYGDGATSTEVESGYNVSSGAVVRIEVDGTEIATYDTGRFARDGIVYEGGLAVDGDGQVIARPEADFGPDSTMIQFPVIDHTRVSRFDGDVRYNGTETPAISADERVVVTIESEYYEQWYDRLEDAGATVTKDDANRTVRLEYDLRDRGPRPVTTALTMGMADGSSFDLNEIPDTHLESYDGGGFDRHNAVLATTADSGNMGGGTAELKIQGKMRSEGDIDDFDGHTKTDITRGVESHVDIAHPTPTGELLISPSEARSTTGSERYEAGDGDLEGGLYYTNDDLTLASDVAVTEQTILVVDGNLTIDDATLEAAAAVDVHVHGSLRLTEDAAVETADPRSATQVSAFVDDDVLIRGQTDNRNPTGPAFTGLVHATNATVDHVGDFTVYGALAVDAYEISSAAPQPNPNHNSFTLYYDERLEGESPYATTSVRGSVLTEFFESYSGDVHGGDYNDEGDIGGDLLVTGSAELTDSAAGGDLLVEDGAEITRSNVHGDLVVDDGLELDDGTYQGDVWVDGDVTITNEANLQGDLYANGDVRIEAGTVDGDVYVVGDLETDGDPNLNGEVHVVGDLDVDGEPIAGPVYVDGNATVSSPINDDLHASGDVTCTGGSVGGDLEYGGTYTGNCGERSTGTDPVSPGIPPTLLSGPELIDLPTYEEVTHAFDLRFAHVEVD